MQEQMKSPGDSQQDVVFSGSWDSTDDQSAVVAEWRIDPRISTTPLNSINAVLVFLTDTDHAIGQYCLLSPNIQQQVHHHSGDEWKSASVVTLPQWMTTKPGNQNRIHEHDSGHSYHVANDRPCSTLSAAAHRDNWMLACNGFTWLTILLLYGSQMHMHIVKIPTTHSSLVLFACTYIESVNWATKMWKTKPNHSVCRV